MSGHRRPLTGLAVAGPVSVALVALLAGAAQAAPAPAPAPGATYVALGSSYAAGGGITPADPTTAGAVCGRSPSNYPNLVAQALDLELTDASCGGATAANVAAVPQQVWDLTGVLHVVPPQVQAVNEQTQVVTLTIGGNDIGYVSLLMAHACLGDLATDPDSILGNGLKQYGLCTPPSDEVVDAALGNLEDSLVSTVQAVQAKAPEARIVLVDYLPVLPENGKPCAVMPIPQEQQKHLLDVARRMNLATKHAAQRTGAELVKASALGRGHDVCSSEPWVTGYDLSRAYNMMHPNEQGHAAVAAAVVRQLTSPGAAS